MPTYVSKFGGSSLATPERVRHAVSLAGAAPASAGRRVVVVSAFGGVTDRLLAAVEGARTRTGEHEAILDELRARHVQAIGALAPAGEAEALRALVADLFRNVGELLAGIYLLRECTPRHLDAVASAGERASAPIAAAAFRAAGVPAVALDATTLVRTDERFGEAGVDFDVTRALVRAAFDAIDPATIAVVTGFVGATEEGVTTTLGRSGSDYTATILAEALEADEVVIWSDVDGVLSADPRLVPDAFTLPALSYAEAAELAHFGAKVLHPRTMRPLVAHGIPLVSRNTLNPDHPGTRISADGAGDGIRAVTAVRGTALLRVEGGGTLSVPALASRVFDALAAGRLDVMLTAQASAEGSLTLAVRESDGEAARRLLIAALEREIERGDVPAVTLEPGAAVVAAVGTFAREAPGLAGRMFHTLGRAHVNVRAIAHGGAGNLAAAVADSDAVVAVRALHEAFVRRRLRAHVFVIGEGALGRRLLALLDARAPALREQGIDLRLAGVADSQRMRLEEGGIAPADAADRLAGADAATLDDVIARLVGSRLERLVVVDATPSEAVARRHAQLLRAGVAVVTPNKAAISLDAAAWAAARDAARAGEAPYLYETTVGAGLGLVATLRDLVRTGDEVRRIEGVLSGTLSYVFNAMRDGANFSTAVRQAVELGYAEPDPRDDLSGRDVARKLAIMAREMGVPAEAAGADVESLVPPELAGVPVADFLTRLEDYDAAWDARLARAGQPLQYIARVESDGRIGAGVDAVAADEPLAGLRGASLAVAFHTARYSPIPLVVQGPGASVDVTAAVVLADVVRAAEAMR